MSQDARFSDVTRATQTRFNRLCRESGNVDLLEWPELMHSLSDSWIAQAVRELQRMGLRAMRWEQGYLQTPIAAWKKWQDAVRTGDASSRDLKELCQMGISVIEQIVGGGEIEEVRSEHGVLGVKTSDAAKIQGLGGDQAKREAKGTRRI